MERGRACGRGRERSGSRGQKLASVAALPSWGPGLFGFSDSFATASIAARRVGRLVRALEETDSWYASATDFQHAHMTLPWRHE